MSLFAPLFLFGLLGIALPVWLHRLQTQTTERERFSSTMFLEESKHRIHIKRKLKYLLLMAVRILFVILLALTFTRPSLFFSSQTLISDDSTHHVIVLDTSFSMHEGQRFEQALTLAEDIINNMNTEDQSSIFTASSSLTLITEPTPNQSTLKQALSGLNPNMGRLDIGAMISSLNGQIEESEANVILHFIGDSQQSGQAVRFADMIPNTINGSPVSLDIKQLIDTNTANWAIDSVQTIDRSQVQVGIKNYSSQASSQEKTISLSINGQIQQQLTETLTLSPEGIAYVLFQNVIFEEGDNKIDVQFTPGDSLVEDDRRYTVFDNSPPAPVLLLSANVESLASTYITTALETAPRGYEVQLTAIEDLDIRILQRYPWLVIDDLGAVNENLANALTTYLNNGGSILAIMDESSASLNTLPITQQTVNRGVNLNQRSSHSISRVDTSHPALDKALGWNNVNISKIVSVLPEDEDRVLLALDNKVPLLLERDIGLGHFMLFSSSFNNDWSDLPVKPVFASFMAEVAHYLSQENMLNKAQLVNSYLQLSQTGGSSGQVFSPDGESLLSLEGTTQAQDILLDQTGYYQVFTPNGEVLIAVNSDQRESDLTIMNIQTLQNWENSTKESANSVTGLNGEAISATTSELKEIEIWRVLLILLAIIVLAESLLSNQYLRFRTGSV